MVLLSHSTWEIWWRNTLEEMGPLACEVCGIGGGEGRSGDIEDAGVADSGVGSVN